MRAKGKPAMDELAKFEPLRDGSPDVLAKTISQELRRVARKARIPKPITSGGGGFRARRSEKAFKATLIGSFVCLFFLPVMALAVYLLFIAADQYISESRFLVRSSQKSGLESIASITSLMSGGESKDGQIIAEYVQSREMLEELSKDHDIRKIFSPGSRDFFAELSTGASIEDVVEYWQGQISISVNRLSGLVTMKVRTFSPESSLALSHAILEISERMVNKLTRRNEQDALIQARAETERANKNLENATISLRDARNEAGVLDIAVSAKAYGEVISTLRSQLSSIEGEIESLTRSVTPTSPQVVALRNQAAGLRTQIEKYERTIAGSQSLGDAPTEVLQGNLVDQAPLLNQREIELKVAQTEFARAASTLEKARLTANTQQSYLVPYVDPQLAERSLYPRRGLVFLVASLVLFLLWASFTGAAVLVRDNMG